MSSIPAPTNPTTPPDATKVIEASGLSNSLKFASPEEALAGEESAKMMSPYTTKHVIDNSVGNGGLPAGGATGQFIIKNSEANGDAGWADNPLKGKYVYSLQSESVSGPHGQTAVSSTASTALTYHWSNISALKTMMLTQVVVNVEPGEYILTIDGEQYGTAQTATGIEDITFDIDYTIFAGDVYQFRITRVSGSSKFRYRAVEIATTGIRFSSSTTDNYFGGSGTTGYMLPLRVYGYEMALEQVA